MRRFGFVRACGESDTAPNRHLPIGLALLASVVALNVVAACVTLAMLP